MWGNRYYPPSLGEQLFKLVLGVVALVVVLRVGAALLEPVLPIIIAGCVILLVMSAATGRGRQY